MVEEPAATSRAGRVITPSAWAQEASGSDIISAVRTSKKSITQGELTAVKKAASLIEEKQSGKDGNRDMLKKIAHTIQALQTQVEAIESQSIEECKQLWEQLDTIANTLAKAIYATIIDRQSRHQQDTPLVPLAPPTLANTLFCTIDTSRVGEEDKAKIEKKLRESEETRNWHYAAIIKDPKNVDRVKLYPVKIDNANRTAILDADGNILLGAAKALGKENNLSKKDSNKVYGSMVAYITKKMDAKRLIDGNYFDIAGESAYT
ncbi:hypothetical protein TSTA_102160 [Talaromyces stipitatus ATCC 10500]|uniref:Uncharacterized protein n=1 Tax=Talaromyces stipitatus (strain ATCC 10500 / CBS 375.48 / QM 6759 / NRRL 1006) TaxID=441959 RepID=B8MN37_TALSN|nr:uncharacterized protein TSTA_102160 [Talaromyces stipitatus ATCC 10500]EED13986.1 hypothetical protein TSTA_102160 [Talaromyces stipitatus ATCC 10500]